MAEKMTLENVRCSYVYILEPKKSSGDKKGKFGIQPILDKKKDRDKIKEFQRKVRKVLVDKVGEEKAKKTGKYKLPLRDGDADRDEPEYEGCFFVNVNGSEKKRPGVVNRFNRPPSQEEIEEMCYSGATFTVSFNLFWFPAAEEGGKAGVGAGLNNVMLRKKGERLDGTISAENDFADYADDAEDDEGGFDDFTKDEDPDDGEWDF